MAQLIPNKSEQIDLVRIPAIYPRYLGSGLAGGKTSKQLKHHVTIHRGDILPYLEIELYYHQSSLEFHVHLKPNQLIQYLNRGSMHIAVCLKAIPSSAMRCLTSLTSMTKKNTD